MRINHNIAALNTHRQLNTASTAQSKSMEKLSSGLRINKAGDDAAGLAISEKMRGQIRGLDMAAKNAQDANSLIQTAEGALSETHDILQRMRELSVQSANDTNTSDDRAEIQKEIKQLSEEIDRISNTTEFNTKTLLNGSVSTKINAEGSAVKGQSTTSKTVDGVYALDVTAQASKAVLSEKQAMGATVGTAGKIFVNEVEINLASGDTIKDVIDKINLVSDQTKATAMVGANGGLQIESQEVGSNNTLLVTGSNAVLKSVGLVATADNTTTAVSDAGTDAIGTLNGVAFTAEGNTITGANGNAVEGLKLELGGTAKAAEVTYDIAASTAADATFAINGETIGIGASDSVATIVTNINNATSKTGVTATLNDAGDKVTLTSKAVGENAVIKVTAGAAAGGINGAVAIAGVSTFGTSGIDTTNGTGNTDGNIRVASDSALDFQIGANEGQSLRLSISDMRAASLGGLTANDRIDKIDVTTQEGAQKAITNIDTAIKQVSAERSKLGATQNRLDHTINNLNTSSENLTAAESRIRDVDYALAA